MRRHEQVGASVTSYMSDDSDFEERPAPTGRSRPALRDLPPAVVDVVDVSSESESDLIPQTFYFSKKLFEFMCVSATKERIEAAGRRDSVVRKGVLQKRAERKERTDKLRNFVEEKGVKKPSGPEHAAIKRKRAAQKKNTDLQMGRGTRDKRKRDHSATSACESDTSCQSQAQSMPQSQLQSSQPSQSIQKRQLWGTVSVPQSVLQGSRVEDVDDGTAKLDIQRAVRVACKELVSEFSEPLDNLVKVDHLFSISSTDYEVHGHILSTVIVHCTRIRTGHVFVRQLVDHRNKRVVLACKLSEHLTGRKTNRKVRGAWVFPKP